MATEESAHDPSPDALATLMGNLSTDSRAGETAEHTVNLTTDSAAIHTCNLSTSSATTNTGKLSTDSAATHTEVFIVRHGERADEAGSEWVGPWWDPPLTPAGVEQARAAGQRLLQLHDAHPFDRIVCSPCIRTLQTASHIGAVLGLPLSLAPGLAECAAAVRYIGIQKFQPREGEVLADATPPPAGGPPPPLAQQKKKPPPRFRDAAKAAPVCAAGVSFTPADGVYEEFLPCVERLAAAAAGGRLLLVGHREGIRDLCEFAGAKHGRTEYCCITKLRFDARRVAEATRSAGDGAWTLLVAPTTRELS